MATGSVASETIERERKQLLEILQQDLDSILDSLTSRRLVSEAEYETLEGIADPLKKSRKLLILIQKKGEDSCQHFLKCLFSTFPEAATVWGSRHEFLKHETIEPAPPSGVSKDPEARSSPAEQPEDPESTVSFEEEERLGLEPSGTVTDKKRSDGEAAWPSGGDEDELPAAESLEGADPETMAYVLDQQRYEPDASLYLGSEEYLDWLLYSEGAGAGVGGGGPEPLGWDGQELAVPSEATEPEPADADHGQACSDSEAGLALEEEEERMEERKKVFKDVLSCLNLDRSRKLLPDFVEQFSLDRGCKWTPETPADLAWNFLMKVQALDVAARDSSLGDGALSEGSQGDLRTGAESLEMRGAQTVNPLDVLCASLLCSDGALQRTVMAGLHRCRFALPLLLPDAENNKSILLLGAMQGIVKGQPAPPSGGPAGGAQRPLTLWKMPVISFVRLGDCSFSKSRILNALLSPAQPKPHRTFLHQDLPALAPPRRISDGLVEIAWSFPNGQGPEENPHLFREPVAVANLRGDLESFWTQFGFLVEVSSAVFFFTDYLGEREWDLLMFLGEAAIERCYFILSPQAKESEEAQMFQRILKLKPSQLLFWEEERAGEQGRNMKSLQAALQEVMSLSLRHVSVEDMASLARELGIQVDQDTEAVQGIQVFPGENVAGRVEDEGQQGRSQPESSSERPAEVPAKEPGAGGELSRALQDFHLAPVSLPPLYPPCPFPVGMGGHFNRVPLKAPWAAGFHPRPQQKWFRLPPFRNSRAHHRGRSFGAQYFQPQRFCLGERFMKFSGPARGHHMGGLFVRPPRPIWRHVQAWPGRPQTMRACDRSAMASQVGRLHSQPAGPAGKPQPMPGHGRGTQPSEATGKVGRTASRAMNPHYGAFQPAGVIQRPVRPPFPQGFKLKTQGGPLNPAGQMGPHPMSNSKFTPSSPFSQPKPSQGKHPQAKPPQPVPSQPKPTQTKPTQPQPSQAKCPPSKPTQAQPCRPQSSRSTPSQPRPTQPKSSPASSSQAKASYPRAGPKRGGKR